MTHLREQLERTLSHAYRIDSELGGGGMSRVFIAEETSLGRKVVVKVLPPDTAARVSMERFRREILLAARLQHPHIVPLLSAGESDGLPYFTMPFVEGESLRARLASHGELPVSDAVRLLREIASALAYAHERGVVHRDIKPDNILLSAGSAMVTDFGVAKALSVSTSDESGGVTSLGVALGTPAYMAPEQASADPAIDHRADIYAFGVLAYEVLTGQPPFAGRSPQQLLAAQVSEVPEPIARRRANLPPALAALVMRCLEKRAADRPQGANEIVSALDAIVTPSGGVQPTVAATPPGSSLKRTLIVACAGVAATIIAFGGWAVTHRDATSAADRRIVVLPPATIGGTSQADIADGIVEEVNSRLVGVRALEVIGRTSAERYRDTKLTPRQIGTELGVAYVLALRIGPNAEGAAPGVRVNAELLRATTEAAVWSKPYTVDSTADNVRMQADIAEQVARAIGVATSIDGKARTVERPTENQEAYEEYLRGRPLELSKRVEELRTSTRALQHAVDLDPGFAAAWAALAVARISMYWSATLDPMEKQRAREAATRAQSLAPAAPETEFALGLVAYWGELDYDTALRHFRAAVSLDPGRAEYVQHLSAVLRRSGRGEEALAVARRAHTLSPRNAMYLTESIGNTLTLLLGRPDEALVYVDSAAAIDPNDFFIPSARTDALIAAGKLAAAESASMYALDTNPGLLGLATERPDILPSLVSLLKPAVRSRIAARFPPIPRDVVDTALFLLARAEVRSMSGLDARGDYAEAAREYDRRTAGRVLDASTGQYMGWAYRGAGRRDDAIKAGEQSVALSTAQHDVYDGPTAVITLALTYLAFGNDQRAAQEAEAFARATPGTRLLLRFHPMYAGLRALPRVQAVLSEATR